MDDSAKLYLGIALMIVMFGMGLTLKLEDFKRVIKFPKAAIIGVLNQIVLLPVIAYFLASSFDLGAEISIGIMLLAACPGGPTSNLITHLSKGDVALSVSLTAICSVITIFTIPFIVTFGLENFSGDTTVVEVDPMEVLKTLIAVIMVPVIIGMVVNRFASSFAKKMEGPMKVFSSLVLAGVIVGLCIKEKSNLVTYLKLAGLIALLLNVATMAIGYVTAKLGRLNTKQSVTIAIESGNQNGTLAITIALTVLSNEQFAMAPAIYSLIMFITAGVVIGIRNIFKDKQISQ